MASSSEMPTDRLSSVHSHPNDCHQKRENRQMTQSLSRTIIVLATAIVLATFGASLPRGELASIEFADFIEECRPSNSFRCSTITPTRL